MYPSLLAMLVPILMFGLLAMFRGDAWIWWLIGICVVIALPLVPRRVDLDAQGITYIPLIPLTRDQRRSCRAGRFAFSGSSGAKS